MVPIDTNTMTPGTEQLWSWGSQQTEPWLTCALTAHRSVQQQGDTEPSLTCFPYPSLQGRLQYRPDVLWSEQQQRHLPSSFSSLRHIFCLSNSDTSYAVLLLISAEAMEKQGTSFIDVAGAQLQNAREGSQGASVCPKKPWRIKPCSIPVHGREVETI